MAPTCSAYPPVMLLPLPLNTAHYTTLQYLTILFTFKGIYIELRLKICSLLRVTNMSVNSM